VSVFPRPILIDEQSDGPCEACSHWAAECPVGSSEGRYLCRCFRCNNTVLRYENMNGFGFQSPRPHHYHIEPIPVEGGQALVGRRAVFETLCADCYLEAFGEAYPGVALPLMPFLMEPLTTKQRILEGRGRIELDENVLNRPISGISGNAADVVPEGRHDVRMDEIRALELAGVNGVPERRIDPRKEIAPFA
jgi:hypothetical protein